MLEVLLGILPTESSDAVVVAPHDLWVRGNRVPVVPLPGDCDFVQPWAAGLPAMLECRRVYIVLDVVRRLQAYPATEVAYIRFVTHIETEIERLFRTRLV